MKNELFVRKHNIWSLSRETDTNWISDYQAGLQPYVNYQRSVITDDGKSETEFQDALV